MNTHIIEREIQKDIEKRLFQRKAIIIYGARQTGKTTLVNTIRENFKEPSVYLNCDEIDVRQKLAGKTSTELGALIPGAKLIVIDEAQRVADIGITIKLFVDHFPDRQFLVTGSSSFELSDRIKEPLTGRAFEYHLYPFSLGELAHRYSPLELGRMLEDRMIRGMYPEVVTGGKTEILTRLADSYLYKDVLAYQRIRSHDMLLKLLQALALQIGNEVAYTEIGGMLGIDKKTVENYVNILEQAFVIFHLPPFSRNLRNELKKNRKIYFLDTGIRNALINNFNPLSLRADAGVLFENFIIAERLKHTSNRGERKNMYFWRTHQKKEIDLIEESGGTLEGFEVKLNRPDYIPPREFMETYSPGRVRLINRDNCLEFVL